MAVTALIHFVAKPGKRDDLITFLEGVQPGAIAAGCHSIAVHRDVDNADAVFEVEYWDDKAAHQAFIKAAADAGAFAPFDDLLAQPFAMHYGTPSKRTDR